MSLRSFTNFILFLLYTILLFSCKKDPEIKKFYLPKAEIITAKADGLTSYEVIYEIDPGNKEKLDSAKIIFDDITVLGASSIVKIIDFPKGEKKVDTLRIKLDRLNHDFAVIIELKSGQTFWQSNEEIVRSSKCKFKVSFPQLNDMYSDLLNNISSIKNNSDTSIYILIDFSIPFKEKSIEVKLNNEISLKHNLSFKNYSSTSEGLGLSTGGTAYLPKKLPGGIYEITVIIDGIEFHAETKIKLLDDNWSLLGSSFPGENMNEYANFIQNDNLYLIEADPIWQTITQKVWKFDLTSRKWSQKNNFPIPKGQYRHIYGFNLNCKENGYVILRNPYRKDSTELWEYNDYQDTWSLVTTYPGNGRDIICLFIGDNFYAGGGRRTIGNDDFEYDDFWKYDMTSKKWEKLNNLPVKFIFYQIASCAGGNKGYVFYAAKKALWEYDPIADDWKMITKFTGPLRYNTNLAYLNNKIYLLGGEYTYVWNENLNDCWVFSLESKTWNLDSFIPTYGTRGIGCTYQDKILTGLGSVSRGYSNSEEKNIYYLRQ